VSALAVLVASVLIEADVTIMHMMAFMLAAGSGSNDQWAGNSSNDQKDECLGFHSDFLVVVCSPHSQEEACSPHSPARNRGFLPLGWQVPRERPEEWR
jgi:hypothetical protein